MRILVGKKNKGTKLWWHGRRREAGREREKGRKEELLSRFMIVCRCGMHIETLPVPKTDFQLPAEVTVT